MCKIPSFQVTALVPMKGASVRVKGKNMRVFGDRPLCMHILDTLENCPEIAAIIVNTDSPEIAGLCASYAKVRIHERPPFLRGHDVPMNAIIEWDIAHDGKSRHFIQTHATNPLLSAETIGKALEKYFSSLEDYDSLFSVTPLRSRFYTAAGEPINHDPVVLLKTQDLPPIYEENSCIYIFSPESFKNAANRRIGIKPQLYEMDKIESMDIDTEDEFLIAEAMWRKLKGI